MKKIFKLVNSATIKDSLIIFTGLGTISVIGFIYTVLLARFLGPNNFGIYSAITALATIVYSLGDFGISPALINFIPKHLSEKSRFISTGFWMQFAIAVLVLVFFGSTSLIHNVIIPGSLYTDFFLAGALSINYLFINFAQGIFTAERRFWKYSIIQIIDAVVKISIVFILLLLGHLSIGAALIANFVSTIFALLITFGKEMLEMKFDFDNRIIYKITHYAKWIAVSRIFSVMISKIDVIILNLLVGSFQTGIYSAASRIALFFAFLVSGLGSVVTPRYSSFDSNQKVIDYSKKVSILAICIAIFMIFCAIFADPIVKIVYGVKYLQAVDVFKYLMLAMIPFPFTLITTSALLYTFNQPAFYAKITAIQVSGIVIMDILLIPSLGPLAPVVAMGVTNLMFFLVSSIKVLSLINENRLDKG